MADTEKRQEPLEDAAADKPEAADAETEVEAKAEPEKAEAKDKGSESETKKGGKKTTTWLIVGGAVVIVALVVVIIVLLGRQNSTNIGDDGVPLRNVVATEEDADAAMGSLLEGLTAPSSYRVKMSTTWTFRSGTSASEDAYVENADTNETDVYFDVLLAGTGEVIYESPILPVDSHIRNITLGTALDAGTYDCVCTYHLVDENQKTLSTVSMALTIVVES